MARKVRRHEPRSGKDAGGGAANGGGGKRGIPVKGWEKGDIVRDVVIQKDDPPIPRKPGSRRVDRTIKAADNTPKAASSPASTSKKSNKK